MPLTLAVPELAPPHEPQVASEPMWYIACIWWILYIIGLAYGVWSLFGFKGVIWTYILFLISQFPPPRRQFLSGSSLNPFIDGSFSSLWCLTALVSSVLITGYGALGGKIHVPQGK